MSIGGLQKLTLIDYPGKIACTVFLTGCNFRCPWCYSKELVLPQQIKKQPIISEDDFFSFLGRRKGLIDGVVICGGEPTINKELTDFIRKIKQLGYAVKLDTNGSNPASLKNLIEKKLIDYIAMDVKSPWGDEKQKPTAKEIKAGSRKYEKAAGVKINLADIKKSIEIIKNSGIDYEFRTTIVPKIHRPKDIIDIAEQIKGAKAYFLQQFQTGKTNDKKYQKFKPFDQKQLEKIQKECEKYLPTKLRS